MQTELFIRKNIYLHFLTRDIRRLNGLYLQNVDMQISWLSKLLNISVFATGEYCIINPVSVLECQIATQVLFNKIYFLEKGLIKYHIRENSITEFCDDAFRRYEPIISEYPIEYNNQVEKVLNISPTNFVYRFASIGKSIVSQCEEGPDTNPYWQKVLVDHSVKEIDDFSKNSFKTLENDVPSTWFGIRNYLSPNNTINDLKGLSIILHQYLKSCDKQLNVRILTDVPILNVDIGFGQEDLSYSYESLSFILNLENIWESICYLDAPSIVKIRNTKAYHQFIRIFNNITSAITSIQILRQYLSPLLKNSKPPLHQIYTYSTILRRLANLSKNLSDFYIEEDTDIYKLLNYRNHKTHQINKKMNQTINVFISFSHKDEEYKNKLKISLSSLLRENTINVWEDSHLIPGTEWNDEIFRNFENSSIILLLISPDFIASDFCYTKELKKGLERHEAKKTLVIPIIIRPCDWVSLPFAKLSAIPSYGKPVSQFEDEDVAYLEIVESLKKSIEHVRKTLNNG